jgi:sortase A
VTTSDTETPGRTPAAAVRRRASTGVNLALKWMGILCLVVASGLAGYIGWTLWGTGVATQRAQDRIATTFPDRLDTKTPDQAPTGPPPLGSAYAQILIPRISLNMFVVEGVDATNLEMGPGHYPTTADPWDDSGRVGVAGHRTTYLHPFGNLDELREGDEITLRTEYGTFRYVVNDVFVIAAEGSGNVLTQTVRPTLVLTTCHPEYSAAERLIVTADRV